MGEYACNLVDSASMSQEQRRDYTRDGRIAALAEKARIADIDFTQKPFNEADFSEVNTSRLWRNMKNSRGSSLFGPAIKTLLETPVHFCQFIRQYWAYDFGRYN